MNSKSAISTVLLFVLLILMVFIFGAYSESATGSNPEKFADPALNAASSSPVAAAGTLPKPSPRSAVSSPAKASNDIQFSNGFGAVDGIGSSGKKAGLRPTGIDWGAEVSPGCMDKLKPEDLLPKGANSDFVMQAPLGQGQLGDKNFLQSGHHIGVNTQQGSTRIPVHDIRGYPVIPMKTVSPWMNSTSEPDLNRRNMEIMEAA